MTITHRLPADVLQAADTWWAGDFAIDPIALRPSRTTVQEHAGRLVGSARIWLLVAGEFPIVSMPPHVYRLLRETAQSWSKAMVTDGPALVAAIAPLESVKVVGPAFIGYGTRATLDLSPADRARPLSELDAPLVNAFRAECTREEWEHGGSESTGGQRFGAFGAAGRLCSLASYVVWGRLAHISIITKPGARGCGFGRAAVACAARHAIEVGLIPQYRTLASNTPSMQLGRRLGFREYGFSVSVHLAG